MSRFDEMIDRRGTAAIKVDACKGLFGREDTVPMWVADMDVATAPEITEALCKRAAPTISSALTNAPTPRARPAAIITCSA